MQQIGSGWGVAHNQVRGVNRKRLGLNHQPEQLIKLLS
jgi:hypothetical protein